MEEKKTGGDVHGRKGREESQNVIEERHEEANSPQGKPEWGV